MVTKLPLYVLHRKWKFKYVSYHCLLFALAEIVVWCGLAPAPGVGPSSVRPSVRQVDYLWNYSAYLLLSLRVGCSSQYAQMIFEFGKKKITFQFFYATFQFSLTCVPKWKCQNATPSTVLNFLQPHSCYRLPVVDLIKSSFWNFEILSSFRIIKMISFLHCNQWGIKKISISSELAHHRAQRTKIWASGMYVLCICVFLTLNMPRSFWGYSVHLSEKRGVIRKRLIVEPNGRKFGPRWCMYVVCICVHLTLNMTRSLGNHRCTFPKIGL